MPPSSQIFQAAYQLPNSQLPSATFPMTTPAFAPLCSGPPLPPVSATQTTGQSVIKAQQLQVPSAASSQALEIPAIPSLLPMQTVAEPRLLNPLPDPWFSPQMWPILTSQSSHEQEMRESVHATDKQHLDGAKKVKHTVTVCAWLSVCLHSFFLSIHTDHEIFSP